MVTKQFLKGRPVCKATFSVPVTAVEGKKVGIVGEFNNWNVEAPINMTKKKDGHFSATVELPVGRNVEFRYVVDGNTWMNDEQADGIVPTPFGSHNSVVNTEA
jgi:Starch binding domain.